MKGGIRMKRKRSIAVVLACICVTAGCAPKPSAPTATPTSSPVVVVTAKPSPASTVSPTPTATPSPTPEAAVKPSPTAAAEKPLASEDKKTEIYIGNKNTKKFHKPSCYSLPKEKNRVSFDTREQAIKKGYEPCGNCNP